MEEQDQMDLIMGIGPEVQLSVDLKKRIRVGTVKQVKEVGTLYREGLMRIKHILVYQEEEEKDKGIAQWVEILNLILIEGFVREEFDDCIPELLEGAVDRFLGYK